MKIAMIASEANPFAKTGGLADVLGALSLALERLGHQVTLIIPAYRSALQGEFALQESGIERLPCRFPIARNRQRFCKPPSAMQSPSISSAPITTLTANFSTAQRPKIIPTMPSASSSFVGRRWKFSAPSRPTSFTRTTGKPPWPSYF